MATTAHILPDDIPFSFLPVFLSGGLAASQDWGGSVERGEGCQLQGGEIPGDVGLALGGGMDLSGF